MLGRAPSGRVRALYSDRRRSEDPYDQTVELIEFGRLSDEQYAPPVGDEHDPWHAAEFDLKWRPKDHHLFPDVPGPVLVDQPDGIVDISRTAVTMWRPLEPGARLPDGILKVNGLPF